MNISVCRQLLTTTVTITYHQKSILINDVIIDTGSSHTVFSPDLLEKIGVAYENGDAIYEAYGIVDATVPFYTKIMDQITIGSFFLKDIEIDVGILPKDHTGLLGLDILQ